MTPEPLPQHALDPIAVDRVRKYPFGNDETESWNTERVRFEQHTEPWALDGSPSG